MRRRHWITDAAIGAAALLVVPVMWGLFLPALMLLAWAMPDSAGAIVGLPAPLLLYGLSVYAAVRLWTFLIECSELGWRRATRPPRWAMVAVSIVAVASVASWVVTIERRLAFERAAHAVDRTGVAEIP